MANTSRQHPAEITNGNVVDATDLGDEFDNLVNAHNAQEAVLSNIATGNYTFTGNKGFSGTVTVSGDMTITGEFLNTKMTDPTTPNKGAEWYNTTSNAKKVNIGDNVTPSIKTFAFTSDIVSTPRGYFTGQQVKYKNASTVTIQTGTFLRDDGNASDLRWTSDQDVVLSASGANGLDTGSEATSTRYWLWHIWKADGTKAGLFSISSTSPTLPTDYIYKRLDPVSWYNDSAGDLIPQLITGSRTLPRVMYDVTAPAGQADGATVGPTTVYTASVGTSFADVSLDAFMPSNSTWAILHASYYGGSSIFTARFRKKGSTHNGIAMEGTNASASAKNMCFEMETDSSHVIQHLQTVAGSPGKLTVLGYQVTSYTNGL